MTEKAKAGALKVLRKIGENSLKRVYDKISEEQIQAEIEATRRKRRLKHAPRFKVFIQLVVFLPLLLTGKYFAAAEQAAAGEPAQGRLSDCPNGPTLDAFVHFIAYQKMTGEPNLTGLPMIHLNIRTVGRRTAFYVQDALIGAEPDLRPVYIFDGVSLDGGGSCSAKQTWTTCVTQLDKSTPDRSIVEPCQTVIAGTKIPQWTPSPNDQRKRQIADELRAELERRWPTAQEIVLRDFNLRDPQLTYYFKLPDGDYYQGCRFSLTPPHCVDPHQFGMVPNAAIRASIFERPYRLR